MIIRLRLPVCIELARPGPHFDKLKRPQIELRSDWGRQAMPKCGLARTGPASSEGSNGSIKLRGGRVSPFSLAEIGFDFLDSSRGGL